MKALAILVVDDDEPTLRILRQWLETQGHRVATATSGHEALKAIAGTRTDLVITDVLMPDGNGLDLIGNLKKSRPEVRILAISGGGPHVTSSSCLVRAHHSGAHALLLKPFKPDQLLEAMRYVMGHDTTAGQPNASTDERMKKSAQARALSAEKDLAGTVRSRELE